MRCRLHYVLGLQIFCPLAFAANSAIVTANNEASISVFSGQQSFAYGSSPNNNLFTLGNMKGSQLLGTTFSLTKTLGHVYTQFNLGFMQNQLGYQDVFPRDSFNLAIPSTPNDATYFNIETSARLGWTFYPWQNIGLTPYGTLGYTYSQLDTGGYPSNVISFPAHWNGNTQIFQSAFYGAGLLSQWAVTPKWVLSLDATLLEPIHPWMHTNISSPQVVDGDTIPVIVYQQADLSSRPWWQVALKSDYALTPNLHGLAGIQYLQTAYGGGTTTPSSYQVPGLTQSTLLYSLGLAYSFGDPANRVEEDEESTANYLDTLAAVNNEGSLNVGSLYQNYGEKLTGSTDYLDRQAGSMPNFGINISKTFNRIYTELNLAEAIGSTEYIGAFQDGTPFNTNTRNTITNLSGRLGYQFFPNQQLSLTPYGSLGYYRWLRDVAGAPEDGAFIDAHPETYSNNWYGAGLLAQWAVTQRWVLGAFSEWGRTFGSQMSTWSPVAYNNGTLNVTLQRNYSLGSSGYYQFGAESDYRFTGNWHFLLNATYFHLSYGQSPSNGFSLEPNSSTREVVTTAGIGYSFK